MRQPTKWLFCRNSKNGWKSRHHRTWDILGGGHGFGDPWKHRNNMITWHPSNGLPVGQIIDHQDDDSVSQPDKKKVLVASTMYYFDFEFEATCIVGMYIFLPSLVRRWLAGTHDIESLASKLRQVQPNLYYLRMLTTKGSNLQKTTATLPCSRYKPIWQDLEGRTALQILALRCPGQPNLSNRKE